MFKALLPWFGVAALVINLPALASVDDCSRLLAPRLQQAFEGSKPIGLTAVDTSSVFNREFGRRLMVELMNAYFGVDAPLNRYGERPESMLLYPHYVSFYYPGRDQNVSWNGVRMLSEYPRIWAFEAVSDLVIALEVELRKVLPPEAAEKLRLTEIRFHLNLTNRTYRHVDQFHYDGAAVTALVALAGAGTLYTHDQRYLNLTATPAHLQVPAIHQLQQGHTLVMTGAYFDWSRTIFEQPVEPIPHSSPGFSEEPRLLLDLRFNFQW